MKLIRANDGWKNAPTQIHLVFSDPEIDLVGDVGEVMTPQLHKLTFPLTTNLSHSTEFCGLG